MFTFTSTQCISLFNSLRVRGLLAALAFFICLSAAQSIPAQSALDGFNPNVNSIPDKIFSFTRTARY